MNTSCFAWRCGLAALFFSFASHAQTGAPGSLDPGFGTGGRHVVDFHNGQDHVNGIAPLKDGRFIAVGRIHGPNAGGPGFSSNFGITRFHAVGALDNSFGETGVFQLDTSSEYDEARAVLVQPDRRIVAVGMLSTGAYTNIAVVRLMPDGDLDTTFGSGRGWSTLDVGGPNVHDDGLSIARQSDGRYVVAGITRVRVGNFSYRRIVVARFTTDGTVDTTFGGTGTGYTILAPFFGAEADDAHVSIALTPSEDLPTNDRITLVGHTLNRNNAFIARLTANGAPDNTFGTMANGVRTGRIILSATSGGGIQTGVSTISAGRILHDGRIAIVGSGNDRGITFMRFQPDGGLDASFGTNGRTTVKFSGPSQYDEPFALDVQGNGKLVAAGYATVAGSINDFFVARVRPNGQIDTSFGDGQGRAIAMVSVNSDQALALAIEPSGKLLAGGFAYAGSSTTPSDFALIRLFGDPDRIFWNGFDRPPGD